MKKLFSALLFISVFSLQGCSLQPMVIKNPSNKPINGFDIEISNYNKINDKKNNLIFKLDKDANIGEFPWVKTQNKIKQHLENKGITLSKEGRPVIIFLNGFSFKGSNYAKQRTVHNSVSSGAVIGLGGSLAQAVVAGVAENKIKKLTEDKTKGDGRNFVPKLSFTISSNNYKTKLKMSAVSAIGNYLSFPSKVSAIAISEFFVPK